MELIESIVIDNLKLNFYIFPINLFIFPIVYFTLRIAEGDYFQIFYNNVDPVEDSP